MASNTCHRLILIIVRDPIEFLKISFCIFTMRHFGLGSHELSKLKVKALNTILKVIHMD